MGLETAYHEWLVGFRRRLHRLPELAFKEEKTAAAVQEVLRETGVRFRAGIAGTGVVAWLEAQQPGATIGFRADMDALPIHELNDSPYRSEVPGVMHACGHDGHTTILLGTIKSLVDEGWAEKGRGRIIFVFQPAEESGGGAKQMISTGVFKEEGVESWFASHLQPELSVGTVGLADELCNASSTSITIRLEGKGGHGAYPHLCADPIVAGAHLVVQLQTIVSRRVSPLESAVLTIGSFHSGTARNVISEEAILEGTLRTLKDSVRDMIVERIREISECAGKAHGVHAEVGVRPGYPALVNDAGLVGYVRNVCVPLLGVEGVRLEKPRMGAEDFAYYTHLAPGVLVRVGCYDPAREIRRLHSPHFDFDEMALDVGVQLFSNLAWGYSKRDRDS